MLLGTALGITLIGKAAYDFMTYNPNKELQEYLETKHCLHIRKIEQRDYGCDITFLLPPDKTFEQFLKTVDLIEQNTFSHIECCKINGRLAKMKLGKRPLENVFYTEDLPFQGLSVPIMTPFGLKVLDFGDETSCHALVGGASRMGKTAFLRVIVTHLLRATEGRIKVLFCDNKVNDLYMFRNIPQIKIAETVDDVETQLDIILDQIRARKDMLKEVGNCIDIHQFRQRYPHIQVDPIFIIVDEFGRYAHREEIQEYVTEIAETAGYLDVHLILAAQRPDASEVLSPRIKANIVTRIAFSTSDATNSQIILGSPNAAYLGKIQGRAILLDGAMYTVQVPYLSPDFTEQLIEPYKKGVYAHDQPRLEDHPVTQKVSSVESGPNRSHDMSRGRQSNRNHQPYLKEIIERLAYHPDITP